MPDSNLKNKITGSIIEPGGPDYDIARTVFPGGIDRKPKMIVRPNNTADVAVVVRYAGESGLPFAVKGGGHSAQGSGVVDGGIVLDMSALKQMDIDTGTKTVWAGTGLTAAEFTTRAFKQKLATGFGDTGSVGIGGITLGGGIGYFVRKYGLTIDDVLAAELVTANGDILTVDAETHPDLFWAIRGGGGNFGVVTKFRYRMHPIGSVVGGMLVLPATAAAVASCMEFARTAPPEFNAIFNVMTAPPMPFLPKEVTGKPIIMTLLADISDDTAAGKKTVASLKSIATPLADMVRVMPYPDIYPPEQPGYHPLAAGRTMFLDSVGVREAGLILDHLHASSASMAVCQLRTLGGAMAKISSDEMAFAHRKSEIMANLAAVYQKPEEKSGHEQWVSGFAAKLRQTDDGAYVNFLTKTDDTGMLAAYPAKTYARLVEIKTKYDPANLFRSNQNIPPKQT